MGDDTWDRLFGQHIDRSFPLPSFDIQDLDTVDDGVFNQIWPELEWLEFPSDFLLLDIFNYSIRTSHLNH